MKRTALGIASLLVGLSVVFLMGQPASAAVDESPDCDTVAIIKCGAFTQEALRNKVKDGDVQRVYNAFGIQQSELNGMVEGVVWKDGRVTVGRENVVARNATTAGRWNNPTSDMARIPNTDRAYKMSTSHFVDDGQVAFIKMVDGKFKFAVIKTCGNPVTAIPTTKPEPKPKPALTVVKQVKLPGGANWQESVTTKPGEHVKYRVVITNTGNVILEKLTMHDVLPGGITQVTIEGGMELNGTGIGNDVIKGMTLPTLKPGDKHVIIYTATSSTSETRQEACKQGLVNKVTIRSGGVVPDRSDTANVKVCAPITPSFACRYMNLKEIDHAKRIVETDTLRSQDKDGAVFVHYLYDFGDGTPVVTSTDPTVQHTFAKDGKYTVRVSVVFKVNGQVQPATTSDSCAKETTFGTVTTTTPPTPPPTETPKVLVDTGAGAVAGLVLSTMTGGAVAYRYVWLRRYL